MSNFLAIATVTAALRRSLLEVVQVDVSGAEVATERPYCQGGPVSLGVNIFLYQVTPNAALRNSDLPTRSREGHLVHLPRASLNLDYLLSFYGNDASLEPQRLLGSTVRCLHERPLLTKAMINSALTDPAFSFLADSDLADQVELVRFSPLSLSLEDLSKLWSVLFQTPYALSVAYRASVVLIEPDSRPRPSLPVRDFNIYALPFVQPKIEQVSSDQGASHPVFSNGTVVIYGRNLAGEITNARVSGLDVAPRHDALSSNEIRLPLSLLPAGVLRPGVQSIQVIHQIMMGTPPAPHSGVESNVAAFVLHPAITSTDISAGIVSVGVDPIVAKSQRVALLLNELNPPTGRSARAYVIDALPHTGTEPEPMVFNRHGNDPVLSELGLNAPTRIWGVLSGNLSGFAGVTNDPARILITIDGEGPHEVAISGSPADLDAVAAALRAGIRNAHASAPFTGAEVTHIGEQILILPGKSDFAIAFAPFEDDPAFAELGLDRTIPVSGSLSGDLSAFAGVSNNQERFELTIGEEGPHRVTVSGAPGTLAAARAALQTGIRDAHESLRFTEASVAHVAERLLVLHGVKKIRFSLSGVASGDYLVRIQVDGAQSWLSIDGNGRYAGPGITVP